MLIYCRCSSTGMMNIESVVPDTITSWVAEAFAFSATNGLGIAAQTSLTVAKPFFVSLELPFSINYEEEVTITPLVFNFLSNRLTVRTLYIFHQWLFIWLITGQTKYQ